MSKGGKRPGAGRKPIAGRIIPVKIETELLARTPKPWAVTIRRLLEEKFGKEKK